MESNSLYIFSGETEDYRIPLQPAPGEDVVIRLRAACGSGAEPVLMAGGRAYAMEEDEVLGCLRYYRARITAPDGVLSYYFEIRLGDRRYYYGRAGLTEYHNIAGDFRLVPGLQVPDWSRGAVIYQIFPDRFRNGCTANDVRDGEFIYKGYGPAVHVKDWNAEVKPADVNRFYGGDLQGILEKLDYLQDLGVEALYLNPVFSSPSNHRYDVADYYTVDRHLSDPEDPNGFFALFCGEVHRRGMKLILDGVFNHCGSDNTWFTDGMHEDYFGRNPDGSTEYWWNTPTLPKLNYENSERLRKEILNVGTFWLKPPYNIDGWRLDVADELGHSPEMNHSFWGDFHQAVKQENPGALICAERYFDPSAWLCGLEWDTVMNYEGFMDPVSWYFTGLEKHSDRAEPERKRDGERFLSEMTAAMSHMPEACLQAAFNQLDNHDHSRFLTRTSGRIGRLESEGHDEAAAGVDIRILRQAAVLQMTWPGAPTLYYGDETGMCGWTDPDDRRTYPWGDENFELIEFYRCAIGIHKRYRALKTGSFHPLKFGMGLAAYARAAGGEAVITVINSLDERSVTLDLKGLGMTDGSLTRVLLCGNEGYNTGHKILQVTDGSLTVKLPPHSAVIAIGGIV